MNLIEVFPIFPMTTAQLWMLVPFFILCATGVFGMLASIAGGRISRILGGFIFILGVASSLVFYFVGSVEESLQIMNGVFIADHYSKFFSILILLSALASGVMSTGYVQVERLPSEYYAFMTFATMGALLLVSTKDLMTVFIGIELLSLSTYVLVGMRRRTTRSAEASLKYFILGGIASAIFLYGVSLLYGSTGSLNVAEIHSVYAATPLNQMPLMGLLGMCLVASGFLFKLGIVPFHVWVPDVYEGASTSITGFMISVVKVASFGVMIRIGGELFGIESLMSHDSFFYKFLWAASAISMMIGSLGGLMQTNIKRILAYSTIAHSGYMMMGFLAYGAGLNPDAFASLTTYLVIYTIMNLGAFAILVLLSKGDEECLDLADLTGLFSRRPVVALAMSVFLLAMAGIPPTAGFMAKFQLFWGVAQKGQLALCALAIISSMISIYIYLRPMVYMYLREGSATRVDEKNIYVGAIIVAGICVALTLILGISPTMFKGPF